MHKTGLLKLDKEGKQAWGYAREINQKRRQGLFLPYDITALDSVYYTSEEGRAFISLVKEKYNPIYKNPRSATSYFKKGEYRPVLNRESMTQIITKGENRVKINLECLELKDSGSSEIHNFEFNPSEIYEGIFANLNKDQLKIITWVYGEKEELKENMEFIKDNSNLNGIVRLLSPEYVLSQPPGNPIMRALRINGVRSGKNPGFSACIKGIDKATYLVSSSEDITSKIERSRTEIMHNPDL